MKTLLSIFMVLMLVGPVWGEACKKPTFVPSFDCMEGAIFVFDWNECKYACKKLGVVLSEPPGVSTPDIETNYIIRVKDSDGRVHLFEPAVVETCTPHPYAIIDPPCIEGTETYMLIWKYKGVKE